MDIGIDYGRGISNIDLKNGIRFGVISQNEVLQAWFDSAEPYLGEFQEDEQDLIEDCDPVLWYIDNGEYLAECGDSGDIFIMKSPYYTFCQFCSPCAPGAGYLMNPMPDGIKTYCFGHDFFEEKETGKWIECEYCKGVGLRNKVDINNYNEDNFVGNGGILFDLKRVLCWRCGENAKFGYLGFVKEEKSKAPYPVYSMETDELVTE